jgi:hypothetical protein
LIGVAKPNADEILLEEKIVINKSKGLVHGVVLSYQPSFSMVPYGVWTIGPSGDLSFGRFTKDPHEALQCFMSAASRLRTRTLRVRTKSRRKRNRSRRS